MHVLNGYHAIRPWLYGKFAANWISTTIDRRSRQRFRAGLATASLSPLAPAEGIQRYLNHVVQQDFTLAELCSSHHASCGTWRQDAPIQAGWHSSKHTTQDAIAMRTQASYA